MIADLLGISVMLAVCTYTDITRYEVCDWAIVVSGAACIGINSFRCVQEQSPNGLLVMIAGALLGGIIGFIMFLFGMGFGDVKMMAVMGGYLGIRLFFIALMSAALSGSLFGLIVLTLIRKKDIKSPLPFAPFLMVGCIAAFLYKTFMGGLL